MNLIHIWVQKGGSPVSLTELLWSIKQQTTPKSQIWSRGPKTYWLMNPIRILVKSQFPLTAGTREPGDFRLALLIRERFYKLGPSAVFTINLGI